MIVKNEKVMEGTDMDWKKILLSILKLLGVFAALLGFFAAMLYAFEMDVRLCFAFAAAGEVAAIILFLIKQKKSAFPLRQIAGILVVVVGVCAVAIPFIAQKVTASKQESMISDIESYFAEMEKKQNKEEVTTGSAVTQATGEAIEEDDPEWEALQKDSEIAELMKKQKIYGIIEIDAINVKYAIVEGTEKSNLRTAVGHMTETASAGADGNCVIAGHRGGYYGTFFKDIDKLETGAEIRVTDLENNTYTYYVYEQKWIAPNDWSAIAPIEGEKTLTLLSCEEEGDLRIIVRARMAESE